MNRLYSKIPSLLLTLLVGLLATSAASGAATIVIQNADGPNTGFNDPTPATPVGGNNGTTVGQQRLIAFQFAASIWGATLNSGPTITIRASWPSLSCNETAGVLGAAGANSIIRNFPGAPFPNTLYSVALANALSNSDQNGSSAEILAQFNGNLGRPGCLETLHWYYGLDTVEGTNGIDLVAILLHEFGHGLGFQTFTDDNGSQMSGFPSIYDRFLFDNTQNKTWSQMTTAERRLSATNTGNLVWIGQQVLNDVPGMLATPRLTVKSPAAIAGDYEIGTAAFGPRLTVAGLTGGVVQGIDPSNDSGESTTDGCSPLTNGATVSGKIALIDRGACPFVVKVKNAQNVGAIGVIMVDNAPGSPPPGLGGSDSTITIPAVRVTQADGNRIRAQLASGVNATIRVDPSVPGGTDLLGRPRVYAPNPVEGGSSISHWDTTAFPNLLMEPSINADLTHNVVAPQDLTFALLRDTGWCTNCPLQPPPNDNFGNAQVVVGSQGNVNGTNIGGTKESGEPNHVGNSGGTSVWYRWQSPANGPAVFRTTGSNFNTLLAVYTGSAVSSLNLIVGNDDFNGSLQSTVVFNAQAGVVYSIAVDGVGGAKGSIVLEWDQLPPSNERGPMTNGATHTGTINGRDLDTWTFDAVQNDGITISIGEVSAGVDPGFFPWIRLRGPDGTMLDDRWSSKNTRIDIRAPLTGTYTVVVASNATNQIGPGNYVLSLVKTPGPYIISPGDQGGPMINGATHTGMIGIGDVDAWTFQAVQNDGINLSIGEVTGGADPGFFPWIRLRGPDGALVDDEWNSRNARIEARAPLTGTYTLVVESNTSSQVDMGNYVLTLVKTPGSYSISPGDDGGPMINGATHTGMLAIGDIDVWSFQAIQNDGINLSIGEVIGPVDPGCFPWIHLRGPNGVMIDDDWGANNARIDLRAPLTGTYTVLVESNTFNQLGLANYMLTLVKTPGPYTISPGDNGGPMINGATHNGAIGIGDIDIWTFQAVQNDGINLGIGEIAASVDTGFFPWIRLRGPDGSVLDDEWGVRNARLEVRAPLTGTYTVLVESNTSTQLAPANYVLTLAKTPGPYAVSPGDEGGPIVIGAKHSGVISVGDLDAWTFQAATNDRIQISMDKVTVQGSDPSFIPWVRLRGPDGLVLDVDWDFTSAKIDVRAPAAGTYTVVTESNTSIQTGVGRYELTVVGPEPTSPLLLLETSGAAVALDSMLFLRDSFPIVNSANLFNRGADRNTRVIVFMMNLQLTQGETNSSVVVNLVGSNGQVVDVSAEDVRFVPNSPFTQVTFRLPDSLLVGTWTIRIKANNQASNAGTLRIRI